MACARPCSVTEKLANFLCHPRQGSGRIDRTIKFGDDGSDPRLAITIPFLAQRSGLSRVQQHLLLQSQWRDGVARKTNPLLAT